MINSILGIKLSQTQQFTEDGRRIAVTKITAGPCWISAITDMGDYRNIEIAFGSRKHLTQAQVGHLKKAGLDKKPRFFRTIRVTDAGDLKAGQEIKLSEVLTANDAVSVVGVSKGKGFAGVVKRHHFKGGPRTHGQSDRERAPGSIGMTTTPGRVFKGKRMAGRMGSERVTVGGLKVINIDAENNILTVSGLVPGGKNALVVIQKE